MMEINRKPNERWLEFIYLAIMTGFFFAWAYVQPFNASPDEYMRYQIPKYIYEYGKLPHGGDPLIRDAVWGNSYAFTPITSYILSGIFMKVTSFFTTDEFTLLMAARLVNVLFGAGTVWFTIRISKKLLTGKYQWFFIIIATSLPQAIFINSFVTTDAMAMFAIAFLIYMWIRGMETDWSLKICFWLGIAVSVCALSYYNAYGFILCSMIFFVFSILIFSEKKWDLKTLLIKGGLVVFLVACLSGWWFIRNMILYDGDILGLATCNEYGEMYAVAEWKPSARLTPYNQGVSLLKMLADDWLKVSYKTFLGCFGYMNIPLYSWMYVVYTAIFAVGGISALVQVPKLFRLRENGEPRILGFFHIIMALGMILPVFISMYYSYTSDYQPQGRYWLPMMIPFAYFITLGWKRVLDFIPEKKDCIKNTAIAALTVLFLVLAAIAFFGIFEPAYR